MSTGIDEIDSEELAGLGLTATEDVLVLKGKQGPYDRYTLVMPPGVLITSTKRPDPDQPTLYNRRVEKSRSQGFADYVRENSLNDVGWTCPPHQLRAHPDDIRFKKWINEDAGLAIVELEKFRRWDIQDGQHRILGFNLLNDQTQQRIGDLREQVRKADRNGDKEVAAEHRRHLEGVERIRKLALEDARVEVVLVVADDESHGQMFADIAMHAKGINPDYAAFLDQRDPVHRIATELMSTYPPLEGLINDGQEGRTASTSEYLMGAKNLADICRGVIVGPGRVGKRIRTEIEQQERLWTGRIQDFISALMEAMPDLARLRNGDISAVSLRGESLLGSATMLRVLAIAWHEMLYSDSQTQKSVSEATEFLKQLEPRMRCFEDVVTYNAKGEQVIKVGVSGDHGIWASTRKFQPGNRAPSARQGDVNELGRVVASWAENGLPKDS